MKIIQVYDKLDRHGGAQSILLSIHKHLEDNKYDVYISGSVSYGDFYFNDVVAETKYIEFKFLNLIKFKNYIIISHSRKQTTFLVLLNKLFNLRMKIVHVSHSVFNDKKYFTVYPESIIAISDAVKQNLINYFNVSEKNITLIYNGVDDKFISSKPVKFFNSCIIKILLVGRIEDIKQQVNIVKNLTNRIRDNIIIDFIGEGSQKADLIEVIEKTNTKNFRYIGFFSNIERLIEEYDFVLLFSKKEGLGLSLIESIMMSKPIIAKINDGCEACGEICINNYNGFTVNSFEDLINTLNNLTSLSRENYMKLAKNSRTYYEKNFKKDIMLKKYVEYINNRLINAK